MTDDDDVVPRYLVLVDGEGHPDRRDFDSEDDAMGYVKSYLLMHDLKLFIGEQRSVEVVRSVRRWECDTATGELLEVGEKLKDQPA